MQQMILEIYSPDVKKFRSGDILSSKCDNVEISKGPAAVLNSDPTNGKAFSFIDLFSGIGGMRIPFDELGGRCAFSSEWDKYAQKTYVENFGELPHGNIREIPSSLIPDHDVLLAGFPCQAFSIAGVSKKNSLNRPHGFNDKTQGTLFFEVARILNDKRPKAFLLENVKNLKTHNGGETFRVIMETLRDKLGYTVYTAVVDARHFVPQHRERIFIVGFRENTEFEFPSISAKKHRVREILEERVDPKYTLSDRLWSYLQAYAKKHAAQGNGFGFGLADTEGVTRTLSARYYKDGSEILISQKAKNPRRLTPRECARLMGYPEDFSIPVSDTQAYKQFGNSVVVPAVRVVARRIIECLERRNTSSRRLALSNCSAAD